MKNIDVNSMLGRQALAMVFSMSSGNAGVGPSLNVLASAGNVYRGIEDIAVEFNLNLLTVDPNQAVLPQLGNADMKGKIESKLTQIGIDFISGLEILGANGVK